MPNRICFLVYRDWKEVFEEFDDRTFRELINAIFKYGFDKEESELSPTAKIVMKLIKPVLERDWHKYTERANINRRNGAKGGRPPKQIDIGNTEITQVVSEKPNGLLENQTVSEKPNGNIYIKYKKQDIKNKIEEDNNISDKSDAHYENNMSISSNDAIKDIVDFYNSTCNNCNMSKCIKLTEKRRSQIKARIRESGIECVYEVITMASQSKFLNGDNDRGWKADIEFIMNPNKFISIYEGKYNNNSNDNDRNIGDNTERAIEVGEKAIQSIIFDDEE